MDKHTSLKDPQPLYRKLNNERNEIRLLSILPESDLASPSVVYCRLETVSTLDLSTPYRQFILAQKTSSSPRNLLSSWIKTRSINPGYEARLDDHNPDRTFYRYTWGDFETLSYTWGDPKDTRKIVVNSHDFHATANLEAALRLLRKNQCFGGAYRLWVDAVCINQEDVPERRDQVKRMNEIYGTSFAAIAWLGNQADRSDQAFDLLDTLASFHDPSDDCRARTLVDSLKKNHGFLGSGCWLGLCCLFERSYWSRLWVIQEIVLSYPDMMMLCGKQHLSWERMLLGMHILHTYLWGIKDFCLDSDRQRLDLDGPRRWPTKNLNKVWKYLYPTSVSQQGGKSHLTFKRLLETASISDCSDKRDKAYGLLALMDKKLAASISPDYNTSPEEVFVSIAKSYIEEYKNLEILRDGGIWGSLDIPSWVPDWTWSGRVRDNTKEKGYNASGGASMAASFSKDRMCRLICEGTILDTIDGIGARHIPYERWLPSSISQPTSTQIGYGSLEATENALSRALYGDRLRSGRTDHNCGQALLSLPADQDKATVLFKKLGWKNFAQETWSTCKWAEWREANADLLILGKKFDDYFEDKDITTSDDSDYYDAYRSWVRAQHGRRIITTMKGYIGLAPDKRTHDIAGQVTSGDLIAVIFGCSHPLVLRLEGDTYRVVGEGYLQGFMEGEVTELLKVGTLSYKTFILS